MIEGLDRLRWTAPEWIARNAVFFLLPHLRETPEGMAISERLTPILESRVTYVDLAELLGTPAAAQVWEHAVDRAESEIAEEDAQLWNDPSAYLPFRTAFARLKLLAPRAVSSKASAAAS